MSIHLIPSLSDVLWGYMSVEVLNLGTNSFTAFPYLMKNLRTSHKEEYDYDLMKVAFPGSKCLFMDPDSTMFDLRIFVEGMLETTVHLTSTSDSVSKNLRDHDVRQGSQSILFFSRQGMCPQNAYLLISRNKGYVWMRGSNGRDGKTVNNCVCGAGCEDVVKEFTDIFEVKKYSAEVMTKVGTSYKLEDETKWGSEWGCGVSVIMIYDLDSNLPGSSETKEILRSSDTFLRGVLSSKTSYGMGSVYAPVLRAQKMMKSKMKEMEKAEWMMKLRNFRRRKQKDEDEDEGEVEQ